MDSLTLVIPAFPPSANHMYAPNGRNGGRVHTRELVEFFNVAALAWRQQGRPTLDDTSSRYRVSILFNPPNKRCYDLDNRIKPTLDALTKAGAWRDDRYVVEIAAKKGAPFPGGGVQIYAEALPDLPITSNTSKTNKRKSPKNGK